MFLPWCGWLINIETFEFQLDYTRYSGYRKFEDFRIESDFVLDVSDSLTVERSNTPGASLLQKLIKSIRHRCHPILFDININSISTIRLNIYQMFMLTAVKFHLFVKEMPQGVPNNPSFFTGRYRSLSHS